MLHTLLQCWKERHALRCMAESSRKALGERGGKKTADMEEGRRLPSGCLSLCSSLRAGVWVGVDSLLRVAVRLNRCGLTSWSLLALADKDVQHS